MKRKKPDRLVIYSDVLGKWRWERFSPTFDVLAVSGIGYDTYAACKADCTRINATPYELAVEREEPGADAMSGGVRTPMPTTDDTSILDSQAPHD